MLRFPEFISMLFFLITIVFCTPAFAHDLGITKATLEQTTTVSKKELDHQTYVLNVNTSESMAHQITAPLIPKRCDLHKPFRGSLSNGKLTFTFSCDGALTSDDKFDLSWKREGVFISAIWLGRETSQSLFLSEEGTITVALSELSAVNASKKSKVKRYLHLGINHILSGYDHLLFIIGIILIVGSPILLVKTITAFTVAHSITLALSFLNILELSVAPVETSIALSIVVLAYEVIRINQGKDSFTGRYPWVAAVGFGLLHGLGFASSLSALGVPKIDIPLALLYFNIGVELGQLLFISVILTLVYTAQCLLRYRGVTLIPRKRWTTPIAYGLGVIATHWTIERSLSLFT